MNALLNYLLEASLALTAFYGVYYWLLRKETNFPFVRMYLLASLLVSTCLPFLDLSTQGNSSSIPALGDVISTYWLPEIQVGNTLVENEYSINFWQAFLLVYAAGILFLVFRLLIQLGQLLSYIRKADRKIINDAIVVEVAADKPTFSFFGFIVIGQTHLLTDEEKQTILEHEQVHARHYHSIDMLLTNLLSILFWFNPIIYLYKKTLIQVHEFEADSRAATSHGTDQYCGLLAKVALHSAEFSIANHFTNSLTLKRITMLKTIKQTMATWKKVMLVPVVGIVFFVIACEDQVVSDIQTVTKQSSVVTEYPAEVHKVIADIKSKNPVAEVQVMGVVDGDNKALESLDKNIKANEIRSVQVIKLGKESKADYPNYVIIEKGSINQLSTATKTDGEVFTVVEESAQPVGGIQVLYEMIASKLKYPEQALKQGVQGKVFVEFIVNEDGSLSNFTVLKGIGSGCDEAAVAVISQSPNWIPGKQKGKVVKQRMVLPVNFSMS